MPTSEPKSNRPVRERKLTGRMVLLCLIGFFGSVAAVNAVMIRAAYSTHGGAEKVSSYRAGLNFKQDRDAAEAQKRLNWQVDIALPRLANSKILQSSSSHGCMSQQDGCVSKGLVKAHVKDANGQPLFALKATLLLVHPTDSRRDQSILMMDKGDGIYSADIDAPAGIWGIDLDLNLDGKQVFHSSSRVVLN